MQLSDKQYAAIRQAVDEGFDNVIDQLLECKADLCEQFTQNLSELASRVTYVNDLNEVAEQEWLAEKLNEVNPFMDCGQDVVSDTLDEFYAQIGKPRLDVEDEGRVL